MATDRVVSEPTLAADLERGTLLRWPACPFSLPPEADRGFLFHQRVGGVHKNISFDPHTGLAAGFRRRSTADTERLHQILAGFSRSASQWLADTLPQYATHWKLDRASFRPDEEAVRRLRWKARNDLLHIDAFPTRPTHGWRILRLFVNLNPTDPRVWVTSDNFATLLERYGREVGLPTGSGWVHRWRLDLVSWLQASGRRSHYDAFMLRLHDYLKGNDDFQERCPKRYWSFPPGSAWLLFTDGLSYADLRGQHALEHSFFIAPASLALPDQSPAALLDRMGRGTGLNRAA
jgi:hypothetical protein